MIVLPVQSDLEVPEWIIFELQGEVESKIARRDGESFTIGTVGRSAARTGGLQLTIGRHQLEGQLVELKKPLAILEKRNCGDGSYYKVSGVIRKKCLFNTRPVALISRVLNTRAGP